MPATIFPTDLSAALIRAGLIDSRAIDDADGYDGGETVRRIKEAARDLTNKLNPDFKEN